MTDTKTNTVVDSIPLGLAFPDNIAVSATYVVNAPIAHLGVFDIATKASIAQIPLGGRVNDVVVTLDGTKIYVAHIAFDANNVQTDHVTVVNATDNSVITRIYVQGPDPGAQAVTPDETQVYVTSRGPGPATTASVIDIASDTAQAIPRVGVSYDVAFNSDGRRAYFTNGGSGSIIVYDTPAQTRIATVLAGAFAFGIAATPDGSRVYMTNANSGTISVINTVSNALTGFVPVGTSPWAMGITPDGKRLYVANRDSNDVSVVDTTTNVLATIVVGGQPQGISLSPNGGTAYAVGSGVDVIDTRSNAVTADVAVGRAFDAVVSPDGASVYVALGSSDLAVVDPATNTAVKVPVGSLQVGVAITPDGAKVYATKILTGEIAVIDTATNSLITSIPVGPAPFGIAMSPDGLFAYAVSIATGSMYVVDSTTDSLDETVVLPTRSAGVAVAPGGAKIYVSHPITNSVSVIDSATRTVDASIPVGPAPWGLAATPDGSRVYVGFQQGSRIYEINTATNTADFNIPVGLSPFDLAISPDSNRAYVVDNSSGTVSVVDISKTLSPRQLKERAADELTGLAAAMGGKTGEKIQKAVTSLEDSLDSALWADDFHLVPKDGEKVFKDEAKALKQLMQAQKEASKVGDGTTPGELGRIMADILSADESLASTSIDEADSAEAIEKAQMNFDEAVVAREDGKFDKAAKRFGKAWKAATGLDLDGDDGSSDDDSSDDTD